MNVFIDIETAPCAAKQPFIEEARTNFKAPSDLTKTQACADLGLTGNDEKFTSKEKAIELWEARFKDEKAPEVADAAWRKTSLDGTKGRVLSIAFQCGNNEPRLIIDDPENEAKTLLSFVELLQADLSGRDHQSKPYFIGHNLTFDLKFLFRRLVINKIKPSFDLPFHGYHGRDYFCTMQAWCERGERISLDNLCAALGLSGKDGIDGSMICDYWLQGRMAEVGQYNLDDIARAKSVYEALTFRAAA